MLLALTISIPIWGILVFISIATAIIAIILKKKYEDPGGWFPDLTGPFLFSIWLFLNLIMWLIFFIIM